MNPFPMRSTQKVWLLTGRLGDNGPPRRIPVKGKPFTIGRRSTSILPIPNQTVSGDHAELRDECGTLWLRDLYSTNGTYVNGVRVARPIQLYENDVVQFGEIVFRIGRCQGDSPEGTESEDVGWRAAALARFNKLVHSGGITPHFQPIVELSSEATIGIEALLRCNIKGLETPDEMFSAATRLDLVGELSETARYRGASVSSSTLPELELFLNSHPQESYSRLENSMIRLREHTPGRHITLEIHEASIRNIEDLKRLHQTLKKLDIRLALDDFGSGHERLRELVESPPDVLKFDMSVTRNIDAAPTEKQRTVAALVRIAHDVGAASLAEGIETKEEAVTCRQLGFQLAQGFYFGRPSAIEECKVEAVLL